MDRDYGFPLWLKDGLNEYLFDHLGLCFRKVSLTPDDIRVEVISLCGSLDLDLRDVRVVSCLFDKPHEAALEQFVKWAETSHWYLNVLADADFGSFRKSDLFHKLNMEFVIPTQLAAGQIHSATNTGEFTFNGEKFFISYIKHLMDVDGFQLARVYGEIPEFDEVSLWDLPLGKQPRLSEVVSVIFEAFRDGPAFELDLSCILCSGVDETMRKPQSAGELLKYAVYIGFRGGTYYVDASK